jgi:hypothetical protein
VSEWWGILIYFGVIVLHNIIGVDCHSQVKCLKTNVGCEVKNDFWLHSRVG